MRHLIFDEILSKEPIKKGWSDDQKYCATTKDGTKYLLRVAAIDKSRRCKVLSSILEKLSILNVPMCKLIEIGECQQGTYTLYEWIEGLDAEDVLPFLPIAEQYQYGLEAGQIVRQIHSIKAPKDQECWHTRFNRKTDLKIQAYKGCGVRFPGDMKVITYLENHRNAFIDRPQSFQHGDYHIGNMMLAHDKLMIIDFERYDFGDPWEEFNRIVWCAQLAPPFAKGIIDGYFDYKPPRNFWECLAFYIASNTLSSIYWALSLGKKDLDIMMKQSQDVLLWYDGFKNIIPSWYEV